MCNGSARAEVSYAVAGGVKGTLQRVGRFESGPPALLNDEGR